MPTLAATPNPAPAGSVVAVTGSGFNNRRIRLLLDGVPTGDTFRASKAGSFTVGLVVAKTARSQVLTAETYYGGKWSMVARLAPLLTFTPPGGPVVQDPVLTGIGASNITSTSALISWTTLGYPSDSLVQYGLTGAYGVSKYSDTILSQSPTWYCRMGEPSGTTATDEIGSLDGTYNNTPTLAATGAFGGDTNTAVTFNGTNEWLSVPDGAAIDPGDTWTISMWIKRGRTGIAEVLYRKGHDGPMLYLTAGNKFIVGKANGGTLLTSVASLTSTSAWYHIVATKSGSTTDLWINGVSNNVLGTNATTTTTATDLSIGRDDRASDYFMGSIDEVAIWNATALSGAQVATQYAARLYAYNSALVTTHGLTLTDLTPSTLYHYRVISVGATGTLTSSDQTFTSAGASDTTAPVLSALAASSSGVNVTVTWTTDELASGVVDYGLTTSYGSTTTPDNSFTKTSHSHTFAGVAGQTYSYRARSSDAAGNVGTPLTGTITVSSSSVTTLSSSNTKAQFLTKVADMTIDVIELTSGTYTWQDVHVDTDRTARPLTIRPALGATCNFVGPATTTGIVFSFGHVSFARHITMDGRPGGTGDGSGFIFKDMDIPQAGVIECRGATDCTFKYLTFQNLSRDLSGGATPAAYKSWCFYISGAGAGNCDDIIVDNCWFKAPAVYRDYSGIQVASSGSHGTVTISNVREMTNYHYAFAADVPITNLVLENWVMTDCGRTANASSIRILSGTDVDGSYTNIDATLSEPFVNAGIGTMTDGGGNSGI